MKTHFTLQNLIKVVILFALISQVIHAQYVYKLLSHDEGGLFNEISYYVFAISLECSIFIFTLKGMVNKARFFCVISILINLVYYWYELGGTQQFIGSIIISVIIPVTIYFYSDLFQNEELIEEEIDYIQEFYTEDKIIEEIVPLKRSVGRPKGSKNKPKN